MTNENPKAQAPKDQSFQVTQRFDLARIIESEAAEADIKTAISEWVDNSLDQTLPGKPCEVVVTFDAGSGKLYFENRNTRGMKREDYESFLTWGQSHTGDRVYGEHGQGGKLAIVQLLDKQNGTLIITSQGGGEGTFTRMEIAGWWQRLEQGMPFEVTSGTTDALENKGFTRIELSGLKDKNTIPTNLVDLAEGLGQNYCQLLLEKKLIIALRRIPKGATAPTRIDVLPIDIPFSKEEVFTEKGVPCNRGKIRFDIRYGMINPNQREDDKKARSRAYGLPSSTGLIEPDGGNIYIRNRGRFNGFYPLSVLKIPRAGRFALSSFAAVIDITAGFVPRTLFKKSLSPASSEEAHILDAVRKMISPYIQELAKEADVKLSTKDRQKVRIASSKFGQVLLGLFNNKHSDIAREFFSSPKIGVQLTESTKPEGTSSTHPSTGYTSERMISLPGIKGPSQEKDERSQIEKKFQIKRIQNPIPELRIESYGGALTPVARLAVDTSRGRNDLFISLNFDSPEVRWALRAKGDFGIAQFLRIGAEALYHEKWIATFPQDSDLYKQAVDEDVAKFLKKAEELQTLR